MVEEAEAVQGNDGLIAVNVSYRITRRGILLSQGSTVSTQDVEAVKAQDCLVKALKKKTTQCNADCGLLSVM